jgi:hypothetical protein
MRASAASLSACGDLFLLDQAVQAAGHGGQALLHGGVGDVDHDDVDARNRAGLRNAIAHGARADDANRGDAHVEYSLQSETTATIVAALARSIG